MLGPLPDQPQSLHSLLLSLERQASVLLDKIGKASANGSVPKTSHAKTQGSVGEKSDKTTDDRLARYGK